MIRKLRSKIDHRLAVALVILAVLSSCAAQKPIEKASVAADVALRNLTLTRQVIGEMRESQNPALRRAYPEAAKAWNTARSATILYVNLLQIWKATGSKPAAYDKAVTEFAQATQQLMDILRRLEVLE